MPAYIVTVLAVLQGTLTLASIWAAPWPLLLRVPARLHLLLGSVLVLVLLWEFGRGAWALLGLTTVTLLLGPPLAVLAGTAAHLIRMLWESFDLRAALCAAWIEVAIPVTVSWLALLAVTRWAPRNLFSYTLGAGFFGAVLARVGALLGVAWLTGQQVPVEVVALLAFAEGFVNGTVVTAFAVYKPHWMRTLDEGRYFG